MIIEIMERYYKHYYSSNENTNRTTQNHYYYLNIAGATFINRNRYSFILAKNKEFNVLK